MTGADPDERSENEHKNHAPCEKTGTTSNPTQHRQKEEGKRMKRRRLLRKLTILALPAPFSRKT